MCCASARAKSSSAARAETKRSSSIRRTSSAPAVRRPRANDMTITRAIRSMAALLLSAGCVAPPPAPTSIGPHISTELEKASAERKAEGTPRAIDEALLPPLRMEMPTVAGQPLEPRFDLSVNNAPAAQVFMSLVAGTRYSMLVHPSVSGSITINLKDVNLREALDSIRELYGYEYKIES